MNSARKIIEGEIAQCDEAFAEAERDVEEAKAARNWKSADALGFPLPYLREHRAMLCARLASHDQPERTEP